jgi:hypothetical protein
LYLNHKLIHQNIESDLLLINSFNSVCIICKISDYIFLEQSLNYNTNYKNIIKQILNSVDNLSCITHLTFVYKFYGDYNIPFFYTSNNSEYPFFNKNIIDLINILKIQNTNIIIDILTCGLNTNEFTDTINKLELDLNLNIRYSINCNNNNWILESNNYDIKNEYFTDSILKWSGKLDINYSTENILIPFIVSDISGFNVSKNSVNLSWSEPSDESSELLYYHVYKSTDTSNWTIISSLLPTTTSLLINALTPNTTYYFKILTENSIGKSNPYNILAIKTLNFMGPFINKVLQKNINTKGSETCLGTTSDSSGNAYVIYSIDANNTNMDIVLQKFDIYGNIIWTKQSQIKCNILETIQLVNINIITDNQNNILFTYCANNQNNNDDFDIVVFKLDPNGDILWSCNYDDNTKSDLFITEISPYITVDNFNNIYVVNEKYLDCTSCIKLTKISSSGNIIWSNIIEKHNSIQRFYPIIKFSVSGYLYLSYLQSYTKIVIKKLDLNGQIIWVKSNIFNQIFKYNIDVDVYDNIYCSFSALDNFIESTNQQQIQIIILKMDSNSNIIWEKQIDKFNTNNTCINSQIKYDSFFNEILLIYNNLSESKINGLYNIMFFRINPIDGNIINIEKNNMLLNRHCRDYLPIISSNNNGTIHVSYESDSLINNSSNIVLVKYNLISSPPTNIQVKNGILSWTPSYNFEDTRSYGYKIRLFDEIIATTTDTFLNLTNLGLTLGEKNMSVTTYNIHGESCDKSAQINFSYNTPFIAQNFICDMISGNQIDLKWDIPLNNNNFDISGYILRYYDILYPSSVTNILNISTNSASIKTLSCDSTYNFDLIAFNHLGNGIKNSIVITTLLTPSLLEYAKIIDSRIINDNEPLAMATITGLTNGISYRFTVVATNIKGDSISSSPSLAIIPITVSSAPINLISSNITDSSLTLSWSIPLNTGGSSIIYYNIYKSIDNNIFIIDSSSNTTLKAITGLTGFTTYYFKVSAINSQGESLFSSTLTQETLGSIPGSITNLSGIPISYSQIDISWNAPVSSGNYDLSGYNIHVFTVVGTGAGGGPPNVLIPYVDISNINTTFYSLMDLSSNTKYNINIEAFNINGVGSSTNIDITTLIPLSNPTDLSMNNGILSWNGTSPSYTITLYNTTVNRNIESNSINIHSEIVSSKSLDPNFIILETGYTNKYYDTKSLLLNLGLTKIRVISQNAGNVSVDISGEFQFTVAVPDDPTNIQIIGNILSWTEPPNPICSNITGYKIFVYQNSTTNFIEALIIGKTNSVILSSSWVPQNTTSFKVISLNTYGASPPTTGGGEIVILNPWGVPNPPTNLSAIQNPSGAGSASHVYINFIPPSFTGSTPIIEYTLQASASGETTKTITTYDSSGNIMIPSLRIGKEWTFKIKATNSNGSSIWSNITTLTPTGPGTTTGDPIITTIYGERYLLPNVNARFLIFNNQKQNYPLYITADCFFLTSKELMESVFISKWSTDYTFMKTLLVKFKNYEITIDMNTLNISYKFIKNIHINIGEIYTDKMILSHHYSANRKRELENNLKFNGKSRKIDLIHEDKIYTLRVSVDLGCADHRNEFVLDGPDMKSGYGAIISKNHKTKLMDLKL